MAGEHCTQHLTQIELEPGLSVSPTNLAAVRFYLKQGWIDLGQRSDDPDDHYFEKTYDTDEQC